MNVELGFVSLPDGEGTNIELGFSANGRRGDELLPDVRATIRSGEAYGTGGVRKQRAKKSPGTEAGAEDD